MTVSEIEKLLTDLAMDLGFGSGPTTIAESGTEEFAALLLSVCRDTQRAILISHHRGLCYDAISHLAQKLCEGRRVKL